MIMHFQSFRRSKATEESFMHAAHATFVPVGESLTAAIKWIRIKFGKEEKKEVVWIVKGK